ncbi:MAG: alpha/beta fold hydrolase [Erysipelotrichaceae bacterium]|nr:alpha/beta fold hydrolase [Erysipelotrichaceae bacterium]
MKTNFTYPSMDGKTEIHAIEWKTDQVKAVLQISHGMIEFIDRYDRFANVLAQHGFVVVGNDHLGHGSSVTDDSQLGELVSNECVIEDIHQLHTLTQKKYPDVPYFLLGHSMGSFLARQYIEQYGYTLNGAIIMGTGYQDPATLAAGKALSTMIGKTKGWDHRSDLLANMALGAYNKAFEPARTKNDWLTRDEAIVDLYNANPLNNFMFTANSYLQLFRSIEDCEKPEHIALIPKDLPILLVSGAMDPVGNFGKGVLQVYHSYQKAGLEHISCKLYENCRHEILNELNHAQVDQDIIDWLESCM